MGGNVVVGDSQMEEIRISPSVTRAELEVHRVLALRGPVAAPFEAESAKRLDHVGVHVPRASLRVRLRVQVDRNSPAVRGELAGGALAAKVEAAPEGLDLRLEALLCDGREDGWKDVPQLHVVFFFQAEDGIRDGRVTGVQTCALPISLGVGDEVRADVALVEPHAFD